VPVNESISAGQQVLSHEEIDMFLDQANMEAFVLAPWRNPAIDMARLLKRRFSWMML